MKIREVCIRDILKIRGWSVEELAEKSGVDEETIEDICEGRLIPDIITCVKIAMALGVHATDLFKFGMEREDARLALHAIEEGVLVLGLPEAINVEVSELLRDIIENEVKEELKEPEDRKGEVEIEVEVEETDRRSTGKVIAFPVDRRRRDET